MVTDFAIWSRSSALLRDFRFAGMSVTQRYAKGPRWPNYSESQWGKGGVLSGGQDPLLQSPIKPVSAEAFMLLQNLIINQDAHTLDDTSKQKLEKHVLYGSSPKLAKYPLPRVPSSRTKFDSWPQLTTKPKFDDQLSR